MEAAPPLEWIVDFPGRKTTQDYTHTPDPYVLPLRVCAWAGRHCCAGV